MGKRKAGVSDGTMRGEHLLRKLDVAFSRRVFQVFRFFFQVKSKFSRLGEERERCADEIYFGIFKAPPLGNCYLSKMSSFI